ncbi:hypothetical protein BDR06DRAFT_949891 [Suillus hirtellus]|nr:hypothetical protein BDR06DRAFT_949891 [Suillus hirtellus]
MDTKLRALKVQELKEILQKASIPPGNAKKQDLINKILANPPAIDVFHTLHPPKNSKPVPPPDHDDLLAPPEEVDWTVEVSIPVEPASPPKKSEQPPPSPAPAAPAPPTLVLSEEDKRKARAARFGTTYVEPIQQQPKKATGENFDKLKARAERFGTVPSATKARGKRTAPVENVDPEEQERRRKRAERFGLPLSGKA